MIRNMAVATRSKTALYLIGYEETGLKGCKLPSCGEILAVFFYHHKTLKKTLRDSARSVIREAKVFWDKARIPVMEEQRAIEKLERMFKKWENLKKSSKRRTPKQIENEEEFTELLQNLFDIAHLNALDVMTIEEDKQFLIAQRQEGRFGHIGGADNKLAAKELRKEKRLQENEERKRKEEIRQLTASVIGSLDSSSEDEVAGFSGMASDYVPPLPSIPSCKKKRSTCNIITPKLSETLDRTNISDRQAALVLAATAHSLGHPVDDLNINRSSIRRHRHRLRAESAATIKDRFQASDVLVVHWDGKILPYITGKNSVDRLAVIVTGTNVAQLLGVPKLSSGSGEAQSRAVAELLQEWKAVDQVKGMCFDTTASNTGPYSGCCILLERILKKNLLYFACRHHVFEIVLGAVFDATLGPSSGPDVALFKRFQQGWSDIDSNKYETGISCKEVAKALGSSSERDAILQFALNQLQMHHPREDYEELLELVIIFMGSVPPKGVKFRLPGAMHRARWMAKALYALKIWMFRAQFRLSHSQTIGLRELCVFIVRVYIKSWFTAALPISAPRNDINFIKDVLKLRKVNATIADLALCKFSNHQWYLSEELIALAFFDGEVSSTIKREMVLAIKNRVGSSDRSYNRRTLLHHKDSDLLDMTVANLVTQKSMDFFKTLGLSSDFLEADPEEWEQCDDYKHGLKIVKALHVVNDHAERAVALMTKFNTSITNQEEQKQYLLQVVQEHRRRVADVKKTTLVHEYKQI